MPSPDEVDPSEVDATLRTPDPRSPLWPRFGAAHPSDAPHGYGMQGAADFREERGYWPPGTPMREHHDKERRDYGESEYGRSRGGVRNPFEDPFTVGQFVVTLRQEMLRLGIPAESLMSSALGDDGGVRFLAREAAYQLSTFVLREDQKPATVRESKTVTVRIGQLSPATWRDHWKLTYGHRWWCRWFVDRRPARVVERPQSRHVKITAEFDVEKYRLYPLADRSMVRRLGEPTQFVVMPATTIFDWSDPV